MMPRAEVVHQMPGRLRVRIPERRNNREYFAKVREQLANLEGVRTVETNWASGSVLLLHNSTPEELTRAASERQLFDVQGEPPSAMPVSQRLARGSSRVVDRVNRFTRGEVDFNGIVVLGFVAAGISQLLRGHRLPAGVTLLWYASNLLKNVGPSLVDHNGRQNTRGPATPRYVQ